MSRMRLAVDQQIPLANSSKIVVVGGGPAGAFFAREMLLRARLAGKQVEVFLIFDIKKKNEGIFILSIYVAFNMPRESGILKRLYWATFRRLFPGYVHDVLWNHSLCKIKDIAERDG